MSLEIDPKLIDKGLDQVDRLITEQLADPEHAAAAREVLAELRPVRDPMARLGEEVLHGVVERVHQNGLQACRDAHARGLIVSFEERRLLKRGANEKAKAIRAQHDADVAAVLDALERGLKKAGALGLKLLPLLLAAL